MRILTHHKHAVNISKAERIVSAIGGGILAAAGLKKRNSAGVALAVLGGDLLRRGITGHSYTYEALGVRTADAGQGWETTSVPYELGVRVDRSITIALPPHDVYSFWRNLANLPRFMKNLESVTELDDQHSHWVVKAPAGRRVEWDAVIHNEIPGELLAWRSLPGADVDNAGSVQFREAPAGRGTEVTVELQYNPPAGALGAIVAGFWGKEPSQQIQEDLHRLKAILEAGEVPTTEGQPTGKTEHVHLGAKVTEASEESFPASDSPAFNH
jgi:uncharacterized membrane protein